MFRITTFVDVDAFKKAIVASDSSSIDHLLKMKSDGAFLNLEMRINNQKPLQILLEKKDYENAAKLIAAGAATTYEDEEWIENKDKDEDDTVGPYGTYVTVQKSYLTEEDEAGFKKISIRP